MSGHRGKCFHCRNVTLVYKCADCKRNYCPTCFDKEGKSYGPHNPFNIKCYWCCDSDVVHGVININKLKESVEGIDVSGIEIINATELTASKVVQRISKAVMPKVIKIGSLK